MVVLLFFLKNYFLDTMQTATIKTVLGKSNSECADFYTKLTICKKYSCEFTHPFGQQKMKRSILGMKNGKCVTVEKMPNNGKMICRYNESDRKNVAEYGKKITNSNTFSFKMSGSLTKGTHTSQEKINNQIVVNPLQAALADGTCVIKGYGKITK